MLIDFVSFKSVIHLFTVCLILESSNFALYVEEVRFLWNKANSIDFSVKLIFTNSM